MVTSSTGAFGGSTGGETSQSRREELELAALAVEKERQQSRLLQRQLRNRTSSPTDEITDGPEGGSNLGSVTVGNDDSMMHVSTLSSPGVCDGSSQTETEESPNQGVDNNPNRSARQKLEAAARASLRTKFDHIGIDLHHSVTESDVRAIAETRGMTSSPPPPMAIPAASSNLSIPGHSGVAGFVRQHSPDQSPEHHPMARVPSPILFSPGTDSHLQATAANMHILQLHHAVAMVGGSLNNTNTSQLDLNIIDACTTVAQMRPNATIRPGSESQEAEAEYGRSSASNSDVDSESDDVSFDDSASDRSDGSDSGSAAHFEPYTAARAMALNRMQQQQRLQSRVLSALGSSSQQQSEGYRPPADSEYQSGDSIDSTRAEDSGGSDSSSSDLAD